MNAKTLIPVLIIVVLALVAVVFLSFIIPESTPELIYEIDFTYSDIDKIAEILATQNIMLSAPTEITDSTANQYCVFFDANNVQKSVDYCTTTALVDSDGKPFGNINMGGWNSDVSITALAIFEVPELDSKENEISFVFQTMIETLVCDECWSELQPGGFVSVDSWLDTAKEKYAESSETTLKSKIDGLENKRLVLEITSVEESYLLTLIVMK